MNFIAPFKIEGKVLHIAISDISKLSLMRNLKTITKKDIELHAAKISQISTHIEKILEGNEIDECIAIEGFCALHLIDDLPAYSVSFGNGNNCFLVNRKKSIIEHNKLKNIEEIQL